MKIIEVGTGYTSIPAKMGAATEIVVEEISKVFEKEKINYEIFDIKDEERKETNLKIKEVYVPKIFRKKDVGLGIMHKLKRIAYSISLAKSLKKEIKESEDELIIHFHNQYNMFFFCKLVSEKNRKKIKIIYTVHSYIWNEKWEKIQDTIKKRYFQEVYCLKKADKIFVLNNITKQHCIEKLKISPEKIVRIDNGVNIEIYKPNIKNNNKIIFFQSGSICDRKNQMTAIQMLAPFMKKYKNIKYKYAGGIIDQEYKELLDEYVIKNSLQNQVEYIGEIKPGKELSKYYNEAKAFIFPSTAEAFSLVILEAMASGLPVIMNRKAILEVDDKLNDVILFYEDEKSFDSIMNNIIFNEEKRKEYAIKSRRIAEEVYSWDSIAKKYLEM